MEAQSTGVAWSLMMLIRRRMMKMNKWKPRRICVELDLRKRLLSKVKVGRRIYGVEYEGLGFICFECGKYGHKLDDCPLKKQEQIPKDGDVLEGEGRKPPVVIKKAVNCVEVGEENFGPWMLVQRQQRRRNPGNFGNGETNAGNKRDTRKGIDKIQKVNSGSRFATLADEIVAMAAEKLIEEEVEKIQEEMTDMEGIEEEDLGFRERLKEVEIPIMSTNVVVGGENSKANKRFAKGKENIVTEENILIIKDYF